MAKIIAGSSCKKIAHDLAKKLGLKCLDAQIERFADSELKLLKLEDDFNAQDVIIVQSICKPVNDHLVELLQIADAVKNAGAKKIIALVPYLGYSRGDRPAYTGGQASAKLVATLLETVGIDQLVTLDLHSKQTADFFKIPIINIDLSSLIAPLFSSDWNMAVVSPDLGGELRAKNLAAQMGVNFALINKKRSQLNCQMELISGHVRGKNILIIDDIADTGEILCQAAKLLKELGALNIQCFVTHPVLTGDALNKIMRAPIENVMTTATIPTHALPAKFSIIDVVPLISKIIDLQIEKN